MTSLDVTLLVVWILFLAVGARLGSLWTAACLVGGFFAAVLVDYYTVPVAGLLGGFMGSHLLAAAFLFLGGLLCALVPGYLLSRISSEIFLGVVDSAFGLITGAFAGLFAITLLLLLVVPLVPSVEKTAAWRQSYLVKPLHRTLEDVFNDPHFRPSAPVSRLSAEAHEKIVPAASGAVHRAGEWIENHWLNDVKKKIQQ